MKSKIVIIMLMVIIMATSCSAGFDLNTWELRGQTLTYTDTDGHGYTTFIFNDKATGGTLEMAEYTLNFATAAAAASGNYADKTWFQNDGLQATFTYDADNHLLSYDKTYDYTLKSNATTSYSSDYEWRTFLSVIQDTSPTVTAYSASGTMDFFPNSDVFGEISWYFNDDDSNNWIASYSETTSTTDGGITTVNSRTGSNTMTITETAIRISTEEVTSVKTGSATAFITTSLDYYDYNVNSFFLSGEETGDKDFEDVWKKGNTVTFLVEKTNEENIEYEGSTAPSTEPTINTVTGSGSASGGTSGVDEWSWSINKNRSTSSMTFAHFGSSIVDSEPLVYAFRGIQ